MKKIFVFCFVFFGIKAFAQIDTITYIIEKVKTPKANLHSIYGKDTTRFIIPKSKNWSVSTFDMYVSNSKKYRIKRKPMGSEFTMCDTLDNILATLFNNVNDRPEKIVLYDGTVFNIEKRHVGGWKITSNERVYQILLFNRRKGNNKLIFTVYNQVTDDEKILLFHDAAHLIILNLSFLSVIEPNIGLYLIPFIR
ncbi:MAG: hypothetical protein MUF68_03725 [Cyclobacteriaceae bacterium]|jgi:hypothetical protein|nr:hypothetical protein [Cyclobacteriaceae bacterium]